jgi:hypothetical protein
MASREGLGGYLADRGWTARVLDQTYENMHRLGTEGRYPFPVVDGAPVRTGVQGPEYMRRMRAWVKRRGVRVLDHSPVLELLVDDAGAVGGVAGYHRQQHRSYRVRAGTVVLATGGCAFLSGALGTNVNTGDGALLAAEAGADLSGMEFSNAYAIAPAFTSVTKTAYYNFATFFHPDGVPLEGAGSQRGRSVIARALLRGPVHCQLDRADAATQAASARSAELLPHLRPAGHQPVHPTVPGHPAAGGHRARHRRDQSRGRRLRHGRTGPVRGRGRGYAGTDLWWFHRRR